MALDQQQTFNWLVSEKARIEADRDMWRDRCFDLAFKIAKNNPEIKAEIARAKQAETPDQALFSMILHLRNIHGDKT